MFAVGDGLGGELSLEVHEISAEQAVDALDAIGQIGVNLCRDEVGLARDGEVGFQAEQFPFRRSVELPLLWSGVTSIAVGDGAGSGEGTQHELVGDDFRFTPGPLAGAADDFGAEGDGFLPYLEVSDVGGHGDNMRACGLGASPIDCQ